MKLLFIALLFPLSAFATSDYVYQQQQELNRRQQIRIEQNRQQEEDSRRFLQQTGPDVQQSGIDRYNQEHRDLMNRLRNESN